MRSPGYIPRFQVRLYDLLLFMAISAGGAYLWFQDTPAHILKQRIYQSGVIVVVMVLAVLGSAILGLLFNTAKNPKMFLSASGLAVWIGMPLLFRSDFFEHEPFPFPRAPESHDVATHQAREIFSGRAPSVMDSGGYCYKLYDDVAGMKAVVAFPKQYLPGKVSYVVYQRGMIFEVDFGQDTEKKILNRERFVEQLKRNQEASQPL